MSKEEKIKKKDAKKKKEDAKKKKEEAKKIKRIMEIKNNVFRSLYSYSRNYIDFKALKGIYYLFIHQVIMFFYAFMTLFCNSIYHLTIVLIIMTINTFGTAYMNQCPLTKLEKKYLGFSGTENYLKILKNAHIQFRCKHIYESNLESITFVWSLVAMKIFMILFFRMTHVKLASYDVYL
jgi:hypothetical protein